MLKTKCVGENYKNLVMPFWSSTSTIFLHQRWVPTFKRCHQRRDSVTHIQKSPPTLSHQNHDVSNITITIQMSLRVWLDFEGLRPYGLVFDLILSQYALSVLEYVLSILNMYSNDIDLIGNYCSMESVRKFSLNAIRSGYFGNERPFWLSVLSLRRFTDTGKLVLLYRTF